MLMDFEVEMLIKLEILKLTITTMPSTPARAIDYITEEIEKQAIENVFAKELSEMDSGEDGVKQSVINRLWENYKLTEQVEEQMTTLAKDLFSSFNGSMR